MDSRRPGRRVRLVLWSAAILVPLLAAGTAWRVVTLRQTAVDAREHLSAAREALGGVAAGQDIVNAGLASGARLSAACAEASQASAVLTDVNRQVQGLGPLLGALEAVPGVGSQARSQTSALQAGTGIAAAGASLCQAMGPLSAIVTGSDEQAGPRSLAETLRALAGSRPALLSAADELARLQSSLDQLPDADLDEATRHSVASLRQQAPPAVQTIRDSAALLGLLDGPRPHRFLLVSQNPDELRATGGYIGSAGVIEIREGSVRLLEYGSSRLYDTPPSFRVTPPAAFARYLGTGYWHLAGANWSPSFPDVARQLAYFYGLSHPDQPVEGVIALDQVGMAGLLAAIGPVDVPEYDVAVSAENLQAVLDQYVHAGDWRDEQGRKQFTAALSAAVMERAFSAPRSGLPGMVKALRAALDEQHLLVSVQDPDASVALARRRWDGRLLPSQGDYLLLLDTEVTASKQSQEVTRDADYRVDLAAPGGPRARLVVTYTNHSQPSATPGVRFVPDYKTFLRAYVPDGATLMGSAGFNAPATVGTDCGYTVLAGEATIHAGTTVQVSFDYVLPATVVAQQPYELVLQQQPGLPPGHLAIHVAAATGTAETDLRNDGGRHTRLALDPGPSQLRPLPLPAPRAQACESQPVQATPIAEPARLEIPSIDLAAPVVELGVSPQGEMEAPATPDVVGWYRMSARPGQPGNDVMSGHVDWGRDTAVFWGLRRLQAGDRIVVYGTDGAAHAYGVEWNRTFPAGNAPVESLVGGADDALLTLITCDGVYDTRTKDYSHRRVVRAKLLDS